MQRHRKVEMEKEKNLTSGSVWRAILRFALPYLLSYFLQTLYGMADLYMIGRFGGVNDTTAVADGSQVMHMLTVMIVGLAMGTTVMVGRSVGARKTKEAASVIGNTVTMFMALSVLTMAILLSTVGAIVNLISVPAEAVEGTVAYLTICFIGIPFITAYNILSAIFRGMGDSKSPMYFIAVACAANVLLDYIFMGVLHLGPAGAALGTTLSQTLSVIFALTAICRKNTGIQLSRRDFIPRKKVMGQLLQIGLPVAVQDGCIQIAFIVITIIANQRGLTDAAAVGVVEKIISGLFIVPSSMLATVSALVSLDIGAGEHTRARQTLGCAVLMAVGYGVFIVLLIECTAPLAVGLFTTDAAVAAAGSAYLRSYIVDTIFAGVHFCFTGFFAAYGRSYIGFLHNILAIVLVRVPGSYLASKFFPDTLFPMGMAAPGGSLLSVLICVGIYCFLRKKGTLQRTE